MNKEEIYNHLVNNLHISNVKMDEPMSKHTSFRIGGNCDIFVVASNVEEIKAVLKFATENSIQLYIVGNGSNLLVKDKGIRGIALKINLKGLQIDKVDEDKVRVTAEAGVQLGYLANELLKNNVGGFEFASGIPGTIGGAVRMNAGAYGSEFKDIVVTTRALNYNGEEVVLSNEDQKFAYRSSLFCTEKLIILETVLELHYEENQAEIESKMKENMDARKEKQPIEYPSAGSTFKRGEDFITAKLIDECGLKGYSIGGAQVSEKHAGFIVNKGNATAEDVLKLVQYVKQCVKEKFGKDIELEVEVIGE